jgi:uncharacterized protein (DUF433 family)
MRDPDILGGEPVFAGTRVPIKSLFDHLEAGDSIAEFLEGFPSVKREQVLALLQESNDEEPLLPHETAILSEGSLAQDWNRSEEDVAWSHLRRDR